MDAKRKKFGFTLVEVLTVLGIIALLVGLLLPALSWVHNTARETKQEAQLISIGLALTAFKTDYGDYPPSVGYDYTIDLALDYCGAQKLAEAILGWDLMGFHPKSAWRADGYDAAGGLSTYDPGKTRDIDGDGIPDTLDERIGPYLELATTNAFRLGALFGWGIGDTDVLEANTFVLCDVFGVKPITVGGKTVRAGTPILYYRANTSSKSLEETAPLAGDGIYDYRDNMILLKLRKLADWKKLPADREAHPWRKVGGVEAFYEYIRDPKITAPAPPWPYRPDSYILISAGADGLYGTSDDITNFGN